MTADDHPFDFARAGRQHARRHRDDLADDGRHVPVLWTAAHPPDSLGLAVEAALGREMTDDEMDAYTAAFRDRWAELADEDARREADDFEHPAHLPYHHTTLESCL